jgi:hypothetical protein
MLLILRHHGSRVALNCVGRKTYRVRCTDKDLGLCTKLFSVANRVFCTPATSSASKHTQRIAGRKAPNESVFEKFEQVAILAQ